MRTSQWSSRGWKFTRWLEHDPPCLAACGKAVHGQPGPVAGPPLASPYAHAAQVHCGWLDSSLDLRRGLAVIEHADPPAELAAELARGQARRPLR